jgi:2,4-diketo-3-deoxy-L-fuconate hydrolase
MRIMNIDGRLVLVAVDGVVDVEQASSGRFSSDPQAVYGVWPEFRAWAGSADLSGATPVGDAEIGPPVPLPPQVFGIGLNYREHAIEAGLELPDQPMVFTKFPASVTGPNDTIALTDGNVDWEAELVAVIGRRAERVSEAEAWEHVAGLTLGQDVSDRTLQFATPHPPQFNLGKSCAGFAPIGPVLVTPDEFQDPDDVAIVCTLNGEIVQEGRTADLIFSIPQVIAYLSNLLPLLPGDLIFTGTPSGIGATREPPRFLGPGDELGTSSELIGAMRNRFAPR